MPVSASSARDRFTWCSETLRPVTRNRASRERSRRACNVAAECRIAAPVDKSASAAIAISVEMQNHTAGRFVERSVMSRNYDVPMEKRFIKILTGSSILCGDRKLPNPVERVLRADAGIHGSGLR